MALEMVSASKQYVDTNIYCPDYFSADDPISIGVWVKLAAYPSDYPILIGVRNVNNNGAWIIMQANEEEVRFNINDGSFYSASFDRTDMSLDEWHLVVGTFEGGVGGDLKIYLDGVLKDTDSGGSNSWNAPANNFMLGWNEDDDMYLDGFLADGRIYDRELTIEEVQTIHKARGHDRIVNGLIGRYLMKELPPGESHPHPFVDSVEVLDTDVTSLDLDVPTHEDGDTLVAFVCPSGNASGTPADVTTPSGWTLMNSGDTDLPSTASTPSLWAYRRTADSEPASYNFAINQTCPMAGVMVAYNDIDNTPDVVSSLNTGTSASPSSPTVTAGGDAVAIRVCAIDSDDQFPSPEAGVYPSGTIGREAIQGGSGGVGNGCGLAVADQLVSAGATGAVTWNTDSSEQWGCLTITFLGGDPGQVKDLSGNALHGMPINGPVYRADELAPAATPHCL